MNPEKRAFHDAILEKQQEISHLRTLQARAREQDHGEDLNSCSHHLHVLEKNCRNAGFLLPSFIDSALAKGRGRKEALEHIASLPQTDFLSKRSDACPLSTRMTTIPHIGDEARRAEAGRKWSPDGHNR